MDFTTAVQQAKASEGVATPMPQYQSHKKVWALKIKEVLPAPKPTIAELDAILHGNAEHADLGAMLIVEERFAPIAVSRDWMSKHEPQAGGYYVTYKDGYTSFSPAAAFEEGYVRC